MLPAVILLLWWEMFTLTGTSQAPCVCDWAVGWKMETAKLLNPPLGPCRFGLGLPPSVRRYAAPSSVPVTWWRGEGQRLFHLFLLCELQLVPAPCCLTGSTKTLFSIYSSPSEVKHSLWWNGTSPPGPEKLACHTEIVVTDIFLGNICFVISQFYSQKKLFYQPVDAQVSIVALSSQRGKT